MDIKLRKNSRNICPYWEFPRIQLSEDSRGFTPLFHASYAWQDIYDKRSACERVFSRLAGSFSVDIRICRRLEKVTTFMMIAFSLIPAVVPGHVRENTHKLVRIPLV